MTLPGVTPTRLWMGVILIWIILLSGLLSEVVGSPGVLQAVRLRSLLADKQALLSTTESEITRIEQDSALLETSAVAQEREIRRVLGYAGPDELIFDFTAAASPGEGTHEN